MLSSSDFRVQKLIASGFVASEGFNPSDALRHVLVSWPDVYDGQTTSFPLPADAPPDFPAVSVASKDGSWLVEMTRARVNVAWLNQHGRTRSLRRVFSELSKRLVMILAEQQVVVGRLAALATRVADVPAPGVALSRQFCRPKWIDGPLNRPAGFELHAHKTFDLLPELTVNSWVRIKTAKGGSPDYRYVVVEQDVNTLGPELETRNFGQRETSSIFRAAAVELDSILAMYFPD